jgi:threonine/homoserine/homoserine lactone efflux protein
MDYSILSFIVTALLINLAPGPAMLFVLNQSQKHGLKSGLFSAAGVETGVIVYLILAAFGLSFFLLEYPKIYQSIQIIGALYLIYLAYSSWPRKKSTPQKTKKKSSHHSVFIKGFFINLTNPKIGLFFISLMPQFVPEQANENPFVFLLYGAIFSLGGILTNFSVAIFAEKVNNLLKNISWFDYVPPILFILIVLKVIFSMSI